MTDLPLTPSDLRRVADALEPLELNPAIVRNPIVGRIEVYRPDGDDLIGYFQSAEMGPDPEDDWYGFVPTTQQPTS